MEIVNNYDVDGVVFDDYFYPGRNFADSATYGQYGGGLSLADWRRANITSLISELHTKIKAAKRGVSFGVSPSGVWANASSNAAGSDTRAGVQSYYDQYADTRLWVKRGYVDYICPQIYWKIGNSAADFSKLLGWWADTCRGTGVKLHISYAVYKTGSEGWAAQDIISELKAAAKYPEYAGAAFYGYADLCGDTSGVAGAISSYYGG
jgi:uncharacterized lipoprotein YddW (UPF0748 family)